MQRKAIKIGFLVGLTALVLSLAAYAQQQEDHSKHQAQGQAAAAEEEHIFCPTMKTGQLCSHGTAATLGLTGEKNDKWIEIARKYDQAVNAATNQLFKDAEAILTPQQQELLKSWFAVGLNPEINQILYKKGLGSASQKR
jgi:hypothetical protein